MNADATLADFLLARTPAASCCVYSRFPTPTTPATAPNGASMWLAWSQGARLLKPSAETCGTGLGNQRGRPTMPTCRSRAPTPTRWLRRQSSARRAARRSGLTSPLRPTARPTQKGPP